MPEKNDKHDLEALAETVRARLIQNGQHGALAEFGKYHAAVTEECKAHHDAGFRRGLREGKPGFDVDELVEAQPLIDALAKAPTGLVATASISTPPAGPPKPAKPKAARKAKAAK